MLTALRTAGVTPDVVDVATDPAVRDRVKEVAAAESFPMLFARGRLIGGVDVVERLVDEKRIVAELGRSREEAVPERNADVKLREMEKRQENEVRQQQKMQLQMPHMQQQGGVVGKEDAASPNGSSAVTAQRSDAKSEDSATTTTTRAPTAVTAKATPGGAVQQDGEKKQDDDKTNEEELMKRLERLVNRDRIMLFMKGTPSEPRCGFSRRMVDTLRKNDVGQYSTFDILTDNDVRQGLKTYAKWPTFPQLYAHGQFVGGLDVVNELADTGELAGELGLD